MQHRQTYAQDQNGYQYAYVLPPMQQVVFDPYTGQYSQQPQFASWVVADTSGGYVQQPHYAVAALNRSHGQGRERQSQQGQRRGGFGQQNQRGGGSHHSGQSRHNSGGAPPYKKRMGNNRQAFMPAQDTNNMLAKNQRLKGSPTQRELSQDREGHHEHAVRENADEQQPSFVLSESQEGLSQSESQAGNAKENEEQPIFVLGEQPLQQSPDRGQPQQRERVLQDFRVTGEVQPQNTQQRPVNRPPQGKYHCEVCDCYMLDPNAYSLHLNGRKHNSTLRRLGRLPDPKQGVQQGVQERGSKPQQSKKDRDQRSGKYYFPGLPITALPSHLQHNTREDSIVTAKHAELTPTSTVAIALAALVEKIVEISQKIEGVEDVRLVGSYAKGTMLKGHITADIVVIMKEPPAPSAIQLLSNTLREKLDGHKVSIYETNIKVEAPDGNANVNIVPSWFGCWFAVYDSEEKGTQGGFKAKLEREVIPALDGSTSSPTDKESSKYTEEGSPHGEESTDVLERPNGEFSAVPTGGSLSSKEPKETPPFIIDRGKPAPVVVGSEIDIKACQMAMAAVRHTYWFQDRNIPPNVVSCVRLMKDYRRRNPEWQALNPWALEVLVEKATSVNSPVAGLSRVLRSVFEFVSIGILLPGGLGVPDPCVDPVDLLLIKDDKEREAEHKRIDIASNLTTDQRDQITKNAQDGLRALALGHWETILGDDSF